MISGEKQNSLAFLGTLHLAKSPLFKHYFEGKAEGIPRYHTSSVGENRGMSNHKSLFYSSSEIYEQKAECKY